MDIKSEEDESPPCKRIISVAERLRTPFYPRRQSQGIITRNRLQQLAAPNTKATLIGTAIKVESAVKDEIKNKPVVNTRQKDLPQLAWFTWIVHHVLTTA